MLLIAIAYETFARDYIRKNMTELSHYLMRRAYDYYFILGAKKKCKQLQTVYFDCFAQQKKIEEGLNEGQVITSGSTASGAMQGGGNGVDIGAAVFDLDTVIQASQAISNEVVLEKISEYLMRLLIVNTGADRAFLILFDSGQPLIYSECYLDRPYQAFQSHLHWVLEKGSFLQKLSNMSREQNLKSFSKMPLQRGISKKLIMLKDIS